MPHGYTAALNVGGDFTNANAGPAALGAFRETSSGGDDWTSLLCLNGARVRARAQASEVIHNPYVLS